MKNFYIYTDSQGGIPQLRRKPWESSTHKWWVKYADDRPVEVRPHAGQDRVWDYSKCDYVPVESIKKVIRA